MDLLVSLLIGVITFLFIIALDLFMDKITPKTTDVKARFPNESIYVTLVDFKPEDFEIKTELSDCYFGWYHDMYICIEKKEYTFS